MFNASQKRRESRATKREQRREQRRQKVLARKNPDLYDQDLCNSKKPNCEPLKGRNPRQIVYLDSIGNKDLVICNGPAGSGKTYLATCYAADRLAAGDVDRIYVTRPVLDNDFGALPGNEFDKFLPYFQPVYEVLKERLGQAKVASYLRSEKIVIVPFIFMRGRTFKNAVVILDEAQNTTVTEMKNFLTRAGEGSQVIVNGDIDQCDLHEDVVSGLVDLLERASNNDIVSKVRFLEEDSVRSEICSEALRIYAE